MERDEELLIKRAQRGNIEAFEQLVHRYDRRIMKITLDMLNNVEDARDLYQEIFIRVYRSIDKFRFKSEFYTWLFRIAINTTISYRNKRRKQKISYRIDDLPDTENWRMSRTDSEKNPEEQLLNSELNELILTGLDQLSAKQKTVFVLRHYHGYKLKDIGRLMECQEGTVKNYLFRATKKMRVFLKEYQHS